MHKRRIWEFAFCLVLIALLMRGHWLPAAEVAGPLSVCGIRLGMTRPEVVRILGKPSLEGPLYADYNPYLKSLSRVYRYGSPYITFGKAGRVIEVSGPSLEWPEGSLQKGTSLKSALAHFPDCSLIRPATTGRFRDPGIHACPRQNLKLITDMTDWLFGNESWFAQESIIGVELSEPGSE